MASAFDQRHLARARVTTCATPLPYKAIMVLAKGGKRGGPPSLVLGFSFDVVNGMW
jgi:hypothetical protein